ncbi:MAG TPA: tRNA (guanine(46)-N(7))-methyltransferase TrmB [Mycobacterium sp.]|nr:tRNA (guanine(46)-N(7))-methyltransferase TrmB [Mycobacterium sp.]
MHAQPAAAAPADLPPGSGASAPRYPRNFSFQSRRSALSAAQQRTWQRLWPEIGAEARPSGSAERPEPLDTREWFGRDAPLVLEIGCGAGTSTAAMASAEPDIDVIAVEVYRRGLAQLLSAIERAGSADPANPAGPENLESPAGPGNLSNIRLIRGDAIDVLEHLLTPGSLTGVRVFFPDPWPKARHHKRRLLQPATVALIADRLRPGGVLHAATDHADYAEQIAAAGDAEPALRRVTADDRLPISVVRPTTKYEAKARVAGSAVTEMLWEKRP